MKCLNGNNHLERYHLFLVALFESILIIIKLCWTLLVDFRRGILLLILIDSFDELLVSYFSHTFKEFLLWDFPIIISVKLRSHLLPYLTLLTLISLVVLVFGGHEKIIQLVHRDLIGLIG